MRRLSRKLPVVLLALALLAVAYRKLHRRRPWVETPLVPMAVAARPVQTKHPRIILDAEVLGRLRRAAQHKSARMSALLGTCETQSGAPIASGYQGFDWGEAMVNLALCYHGTGKAAYAEAAVHYLQALIDDKEKIGDGQGGETVVQHDSGYGIRSFGVYSALGYDWLHDAPGMTPALRGRIASRLFSWLRWYREKGYQREFPISNYFAGYFAAAAFSALAVAGESPEADSWLKFVRDDLIGKRVLPEYGAKLRGGDFPEGWQYGELVVAEMALVTHAMRTATGVDLLPQFPWLAEVVRHHVHALAPTGSTVYDGGDWGERPTKASSLALIALTLVLHGSSAARADEARWMVGHALPELDKQFAWIGVLADRPGAHERDPRAGAATSYHMPGTGLTFLRSDWSPSAVWVTFQAGPPVASDHQHADQGHFELWRGADALLVDGGEYGSASTASHNSILIDDDKRVLNYTPNQGVWGRGVRTTRFYDGGKIASMTGDLTEAYLPACVRDGCTKQVAKQVERTLVYIRPRALVISDRVRLEKDSDGVIWAAHVTTSPKIQGTRASATVGASRVEVVTLAPVGAAAAARKEPTPFGEGPWRNNVPWGPMWRLEVVSPRGTERRQFLHLVVAYAKDEPALASERVDGQGMGGAHFVDGGHAVTVLFAESEEGGSATVPGPKQTLFVAGLQPQAGYALTARPEGSRCRIEAKKTAAAGKASAGGTLERELEGCALR